MDEMQNYLKEHKFEIKRTQNNRHVYVSEKTKFFETLHNELVALSKTYNKKIDEMQFLFMECCCDISDLKKCLALEAQNSHEQLKKFKWSIIEDVSIQSD